MGQPYGFGYGPTADLASWGGSGAWLIDALLAVVPLMIGYIAFFATIGGNDSPSAAGGIVLFFAGSAGWQ